MKRKEFLTREERIPLIKSVHRLCELRRAKASRQSVVDEAARQGRIVKMRKCKRCGEMFPIVVPRENRRLYCDECAKEHRREQGRKRMKKFNDAKRRMKARQAKETN